MLLLKSDDLKKVDINFCVYYWAQDLSPMKIVYMKLKIWFSMTTRCLRCLVVDSMKVDEGGHMESYHMPLMHQ